MARTSFLGAAAGAAGVVVGGWFRWNQRRSRPATWVPARLRAGARLSPEKAGGKSAGGLAPWTPFFYGPLVGTRSFWRLCRIVPVVGLFRNPSTCPDLETFFPKNAFQHIFLENASQIGLSIPEGIAPRTDQRERSPKRASDSKRTIKPGVQGRSPGPLSPHFSGEMGTPAGQAGPPGRCAPRPVSTLPTRRVRSTALPLAGGWVGTSAGPDLRRGSPPDSGREPGFLRRKPEERAPGAAPPGPPFLWPARWHSLVLGLGVTLFQSWGYYGAHLRALIWGAFSCGSTQPRGFPLGGSCHRR